MYVPPPDSPRARRPRRLSSMRRAVPPPQPPSADGTQSRSSPAQPEFPRESVSLSSLLPPGSALKAKLSRRHASKVESTQYHSPSSYHPPASSPLSTDPLFVLFPPAQTLQNLLVPGLLNVPLLNWGVGSNSSLVSLAAHMSARGTGCETTIAHTYAFGMKHGASPRVLLGEQPLTSAQNAVKEVARKLGVMDKITNNDKQKLFRSISSTALVEWIVFAASLMGYLSTIAYAVDTGLDPSIVGEGTQVTSATRKQRPPPRANSQGRNIHQMPRSLPRAAAHNSTHSAANSKSDRSSIGPLSARTAVDLRHVAGVPGSWPRLGRYLNRNIGHEFPIFRCFRHSRASRALAATLLRAIEGPDCMISLRVKCLVAILYGSLHGNQRMVAEFKKLARLRGLRTPVFRAVEAFARESDVRTADLRKTRSCLEFAGMNHQQQAVLFLAKMSARKQKSSHVLLAAAQHIGAEPMAEVFSWVAVLSVFHRLYLFYLPDDEFEYI